MSDAKTGNRWCVHAYATFCTTCHVQMSRHAHARWTPRRSQYCAVLGSCTTHTRMCAPSVCISSGRTVSCTSNSLGILPGRESVKTYDTTESLDIREACAHECILYSGIGSRDYCIHLYLPDRVSTVIAALRCRKESGMLTSSSLIRRYMYA